MVNVFNVVHHMKIKSTFEMTILVLDVVDPLCNADDALRTAASELELDSGAFRVRCVERISDALLRLGQL